MIPTALPSASGGISGFRPGTISNPDGSNAFVEAELEALNDTGIVGSLNKQDDALSQLYRLSQDNPEYMELYLKLLAERENTTNAQAWYEKMSSSQYQRAAEDLRKAGLNPYLALQALGGAGSGSVSPAETWSTSPYANAMQKEANRNQALTARSNMLKSLAGVGTAILALLALLA